MVDGVLVFAAAAVKSSLLRLRLLLIAPTDNRREWVESSRIFPSFLCLINRSAILTTTMCFRLGFSYVTMDPTKGPILNGQRTEDIWVIVESMNLAQKYLYHGTECGMARANCQRKIENFLSIPTNFFFLPVGRLGRVLPAVRWLGVVGSLCFGVTYFVGVASERIFFLPSFASRSKSFLFRSIPKKGVNGKGLLAI